MAGHWLVPGTTLFLHSFYFYLFFQFILANMCKLKTISEITYQLHLTKHLVKPNYET